jgi:hypothetical protein
MGIFPFAVLSGHYFQLILWRIASHGHQTGEKSRRCPKKHFLLKITYFLIEKGEKFLPEIGVRIREAVVNIRIGNNVKSPFLLRIWRPMRQKTVFD